LQSADNLQVEQAYIVEVPIVIERIIAEIAKHLGGFASLSRDLMRRPL
jgi:hypothetical protein